MAGLIQQQQQTPPQKQQPSGGHVTITPDSIEKQLHLNPQQKQQLQRLVVAGLKVMFSQQTRQLLLQAMQGNAPIAQKLGQGIAGLMGVLFSESQGAMPQQLLVPAGMVLLVHAAEFLEQAGQQITNDDISQALEIFIRTVMQHAGLNTDKLADIGHRGPQAAPPAAPAAPAPQPPQGIVQAQQGAPQ